MEFLANTIGRRQLAGYSCSCNKCPKQRLLECDLSEAQSQSTEKGPRANLLARGVSGHRWSLSGLAPALSAMPWQKFRLQNWTRRGLARGLPNSLPDYTKSRKHEEDPRKLEEPDDP